MGTLLLSFTLFGISLIWYALRRYLSRPSLPEDMTYEATSPRNPSRNPRQANGCISVSALKTLNPNQICAAMAGVAGFLYNIPGCAPL